MVWTSTDHGRQWKESDVALPTVLENRSMLIFDIAHTPFGYVAVGAVDVADEEAFEELADSATGFILYSADGKEWTAAELKDVPPFSEFDWTDLAIYGTFFGYGTWQWTPPSPAGRT